MSYTYHWHEIFVRFSFNGLFYESKDLLHDDHRSCYPIKPTKSVLVNANRYRRDGTDTADA